MAATSENSKPCKNDQAHKFTGKENSPKGIGYCANAESIGTLMEGRDKKLWMVTLKNGVKQWSLVPESLSLVDLKKQVPVLSNTIVMAKPVVEEEKNEMVAVEEEKKVTKPRAKKETDEEKKVTKPRAKKELPPIADVPALENTEKTEKVKKPRAKKEKVEKVEKVEKTVTVEEKATTAEEKADDEATTDMPQKTKKPRAKKDADKPEKAKKAPNVFNLFVQKTIPELKEQYPGLKLPEYMKMVSEAWKKEKDNVE